MDTNNLPTLATDVIEILANRPEDDQDKIIDLLCDMLGETADCGADIDEIEYDGDDFRIAMTAGWSMVDNGIGPYEFWGSCGVDHQWEPELDDEAAFDVDFEQTCFKAIGLEAVTRSTSDIDWGDVCDERGTADCNAYARIFVVDAAKFNAWANEELAKLASKSEHAA